MAFVRVKEIANVSMPVPKRIPQIMLPGISEPQALMPGEIHLYVVSITTLQQDEALLKSYINREEQARARRFLKPQHGRQYRNVRGMLRKLLSYYLNTAPAEIEIAYAEYGKPLLQDSSAPHFNLSHSRDMAAYTFSGDHRVGVDIEYMRQQKDLAAMTGHVGSSKEQAELRGLSEAEAYESFYRLWTRKEAFIKACGRGLGMGLRSIHIGTKAYDSPLAVEYRNQTQTGWYVQDATAPQGYKLAVASGKSDCT